MFNIVRVLYQQNKKIVVATSVRNELKKLAHNPSTAPVTQNRARTMLQNLSNLKADDKIEFYGKATSKFADPVFLTTFSQEHLSGHLMLITQDHKLSLDILDIAKRRSVKTANEIKVMRVTRNGSLQQVKPNWKSKGSKPGSGAQGHSTAPRSFICEFCGKTFTLPAGTKDHPKFCPDCNKLRTQQTDSTPPQSVLASVSKLFDRLFSR